MSGKSWRCNECGKVGPWVRGQWRWYCGPWSEDGTDGVVCSEGCDAAMLSRWERRPDSVAPFNHRVGDQG